MGAGPIISTTWKRIPVFRHRVSLLGKLILQQQESRKCGHGPISRQHEWTGTETRWVDVSADDAAGLAYSTTAAPIHTSGDGA